MADLAASTVKINDVESAQNAPMSEATIQKIGGAINHLLDLDIGTRVTNLETAPQQFTISFGSADFAPLVTGTKFSVVSVGRPILFITHNGSVQGSSGQNPAIKTGSTSIATLTTSGAVYIAVATQIKVLTLAAGTHNFFFERANSVGSTNVSGVEIIAITL